MPATNFETILFTLGDICPKLTSSDTEIPALIQSFFGVSMVSRNNAHNVVATIESMGQKLRDGMTVVDGFLQHLLWSRSPRSPEVNAKLLQIGNSIAFHLSKIVLELIHDKQVLISSKAERFVAQRYEHIARGDAEGTDNVSENLARSDISGSTVGARELCVICQEDIAFEGCSRSRCGNGHHFSEYTSRDRISVH